MIETPEEFAFIMDSLIVTVGDRPNKYERRKGKAKFIAAHDAAIRAECAERAIAWVQQWGDWSDCTKQALRAAITGEQ